MESQVFIYFAVGLLSGLPLSHAQIPTPKSKYHFKPTNPFNSIDTSARGLNNWDVIVGDYTTAALDAAGTELGFSKSGNKVKKIEFPKSGHTDGQSINNRGIILGMWDEAPESTSVGKDHGFLLDGDDYDQLPDPSDPKNPTAIYSLFADWNAINDENDVVGVAAQQLSVNNFGPNRGFVFKDGKYFFFDAPAPATFTEANGINNSGDIVGEAGGSTEHAFLRRSNGKFYVFTYNNDPTLPTVAYGINNYGDIAGVYTTSEGRDHGFIVRGFPDDPKWETVDFMDPSSPNTPQDTKISAINDDRDIAGTVSPFNSPAGSKGFLGELDED